MQVLSIGLCLNAGSSSQNAAIIGGLVGAAAAALLLCILVLILFLRRRRRVPEWTWTGIPETRINLIPIPILSREKIAYSYVTVLIFQHQITWNLQGTLKASPSSKDRLYLHTMI